MKRNRVICSVVLLLCVMDCFALGLWKTFFGSGSYTFIHQTDNWDDVRIEIIEVDGEIVSTDFTETPFAESYNEDKITVLAVIQDQQQFICDLEKLPSYQPLGTPIGSIDGVMIRFTFSDGDVELVSSWGSALISGEEVFVATKTFEQEAYDHFVSHWLEEIQTACAENLEISENNT